MSSEDIRNARLALRQACDDAISATVPVLPFDQNEINLPAVTIQTAGQQPAYYPFWVRIYVDVGQDEEQQDLMDSILSDLEDGLPDTYPRTSFEWQFDDRRGYYVMIGTVQAPREDF